MDADDSKTLELLALLFIICLVRPCLDELVEERLIESSVDVEDEEADELEDEEVDEEDDEDDEVEGEIGTGSFSSPPFLLLAAIDDLLFAHFPVESK